MSELRERIARALHDLYWTKYQNKDGAWCEGNWLLSKIEREAYLEEADAVLKVLAEPGEDVIERAAEAIDRACFGQELPEAPIDLARAALAALVGGERDE